MHRHGVAKDMLPVEIWTSRVLDGVIQLQLRKKLEALPRVTVHYFEDHGDFAVTASARIWLSGELEWEGSKVLSRNEVWEVGTVNWPESTFGPSLEEPYASSRRSCF